MASSLSFCSALVALFVTYLFGFVSCGSVQFVEQAANIQFTLSTVPDAGSTDLVFQLSAPQNAGWGAVGVGDQMAGAMMFILVPNGSDSKDSPPSS